MQSEYDAEVVTELDDDVDVVGLVLDDDNDADDAELDDGVDVFGQVLADDDVDDAAPDAEVDDVLMQLARWAAGKTRHLFLVDRL